MERKKLLAALIEEQKRVIMNIEESVKRYEVASDIDESSTIEIEDLSRQVEFKDMQMRFEVLLKEAKTNMTFLEQQLKYGDHPGFIEKGSFIETENYYVFIGLSLPKFTIDHKDVYCISTDAPVYESIADKKVGDSLHLTDRQSKIVRIF